MKSYYYVMIRGGGIPRHESIQDAQRKAEEIASQNHGTAVEILKCVGISSTPDPQASTFWMDGVRTPEDDDQDAAIRALVQLSMDQQKEIINLQKEIDRIKTL